MDLDGRQSELCHNLGVLDLHGLIDSLALEPLGGEAGAGDGRTAAEGLELGIFDDARDRVNLDLKLHDVAALGRAHHAGAHIRVGLIHRAHVARVCVVIYDFIGICHCCSPKRLVRGPFHFGKVDAFLEHFPQR